MTLHEVMTPTFWLTIAGMATAWYFYQVNPIVPIRLRRKMRFLHRLLVEQYYLDKLYQKVFVNSALWLGNAFWRGIDVTVIDDWIIGRFFIRGAKRLGRFLWKAGDVVLIDGLFVNGGARLTMWLASVLRHVQSGYLYHYVFVMILGLLCLLFWFAPISLK